jgi:endonuclease III related protein
MVGTYLTQNTSWNNVELTLRRLRSARLLSLAAIRGITVEQLESMIQPSGYFRQKAARLKIFVEFVDRHYGRSLKRMFAQPTEKLRGELLSLNGVGPETADSILLYAGQHPVFVVDAYARRILERHEILPAGATYDEIRELFEGALASKDGFVTKRKSRSRREQVSVAQTSHTPSRMSRVRRSATAQTFNDAHALIVAVGKHYCFKSEPDCEHCPLRKFLPKSRLRHVPVPSRKAKPYNWKWSGFGLTGISRT